MQLHAAPVSHKIFVDLLPTSANMYALLCDFEMLTNFTLRLPLVCGLDPAGPDR